MDSERAALRLEAGRLLERKKKLDLTVNSYNVCGHVNDMLNKVVDVFKILLILCFVLCIMC